MIAYIRPSKDFNHGELLVKILERKTYREYYWQQTTKPVSISTRGFHYKDKSHVPECFQRYRPYDNESSVAKIYENMLGSKVLEDFETRIEKTKVYLVHKESKQELLLVRL